MTGDEREPEIQPDEIQVPQEDAQNPPRPALDDDQMATLTRLLKVMYPHAQFPDGPYERSAEVVRDSAQTDLPALNRDRKWHVFSNTDMPDSEAMNTLGKEPLTTSQDYVIMGPRSVMILVGK